jgi:hypothetical protein
MQIQTAVSLAIRNLLECCRNNTVVVDIGRGQRSSCPVINPVMQGLKRWPDKSGGCFFCRFFPAIIPLI